MDHVRQIQEIVDEHKEEMPTGVVTDVMEQCQKAYNAIPNLWKVSYVKIHAVAKNKAVFEPRYAIFEEASFDFNPKNWCSVFDLQKMPHPQFHKEITGPSFSPFPSEGCVVVVTGVKKWGKRAREE